MTHPKKRILILTTKTGGGHRSSADAVKEILLTQYSDQIEVTDVNFFEEYVSRPLGDMPKIYPLWVQIPKAWETSYKLTATQNRSRVILEKLGNVYSKDIARLLQENPCDLIISFHFAVNGFFKQLSLLEHTPPIIEVVTDLATIHPFWYDKRITKVVVPTDEAYQAALDYGMKKPQVELIGLPISQKFLIERSKGVCRKSLGLNNATKIVLVMAGGDGLGKIKSLVRKLDTIKGDFELVIIAGRNTRLKKSLEKLTWQHKTHIFGFTTEIAEIMKASDILFTKAGPSTICEGLASELPIVLYDFLPGQEEGNVDYVVKNEAGLWVENVRAAAVVLQHLLADPKLIDKYAANAKKLAHGNAAEQIAKLVIDYKI